MKKIITNRIRITDLTFLLLSFIQGCCLILSGDDIDWYFTGFSDLFGGNSENGRYFTNIITLIMIKYTPLRIIIYTLFMYLLFRLVSKIISKGNDSYLSAFISALLILLIPVNIARQTTMWVSGFTNYIISAVLCFSYILYCKPLLSGKNISYSLKHAVLMLPLGIAGALCVESITVYNIVFSLFILIYCISSKKKTDPGCILYFTGTVTGTVILFLNHNYHSIFNNNDTTGKRSIELNIIEIITKSYRIIGEYAKPFWLFQLIIAASVIYKATKNSDKVFKKENKYVIPSLFITAAFSGYSAFANTAADFTVISPSYRFQAFEVCFTLLYLISLAYSSTLLFDRSTALMTGIYIASTVIVTAPFLMAEPVTKRCFFSDYVFWILLTGNIVTGSVNDLKVNDCRALKIAASSVIMSLSMLFGFISILNKYTDILRIKYMKEQIKSDSKSLIIIDLPYPEYSFDLLGSSLMVSKTANDSSLMSASEKEEQMNKSYKRSLLSYYGIKENIENKPVLQTTLYNYFLD